jgi:hypothetical protein
MTPKLPQELFDISLDFLHRDFSSLMSCSLVCWDWLRSSRFHLFDNLAIYFAPSAALRGKPMNLHGFLDLIDDSHNTFTPFLRAIVIEIRGQSLELLVRKLIDARVRLSKLTITLFGDETCLRNFSSLNVDITNLTIKLRVFIMSSICEALAPVLSFAAAFPSLRMLSIRNPFTTPFSVKTSKYVDLTNFRRLRCLDIGAHDTEPMFKWLLSTGWEPCLEVLRASTYRYEHRTYGPTTFLNAFLLKTSLTLKHLDLGVRYPLERFSLDYINPGMTMVVLCYP